MVPGFGSGRALCPFRLILDKEEPAAGGGHADLPLQPFFGDFEGLEHGFGFVHGLFVFEGGDGIGHDARAGLEVGARVFHQYRADDDAGIQVAGKIEVEDRAAVQAAA